MPKRLAKQDETENCKKTREDEKNWNNMPNEIKELIMKNMDLITRTRLKMCSKSDKALVEAFPVVVTKLSIEKSSLTILIPDNEIKISRNGTKVTIIKYGKVREKLFETIQKAKETIIGYFNGILPAKNIRIERFNTDWDFNEFFIPFGHMFHFDSVGIYCDDYGETMKWLRSVAPGVKEITTDWMSRLEGVGDIPCVLNAKYLHFGRTDINDEQLLRFKATNLLLAPSNVTIDGIRKLSKKWIDEDYPAGSKFDIRILSSETLTIEQLFDGESIEVKMDTSKAMIQMGHNIVISFQMIESTRYHVYGHVLSKT